jgi:predicted metal-dependent hydrolase
MLLRQDGISRKMATADRQDVLSRNQGELPRTVWLRIRDYLRRDFHPNDIGDVELARERLAEVGIPTPDVVSQAGV